MLISRLTYEPLCLTVKWIWPFCLAPSQSTRLITWRERIVALPSLIPPLGIFIVVVGSIYAGLATPTEAASLGVVAAMALAAANGTLTLSMLLTTAPLITPIVVALGFDPVWFGILLMVLLETALITPPIGINLYVVQGIRGRGEMLDVMKGAAPLCFNHVCYDRSFAGFPRHRIVDAITVLLTVTHRHLSRSQG